MTAMFPDLHVNEKENPMSMRSLCSYGSFRNSSIQPFTPSLLRRSTRGQVRIFKIEFHQKSDPKGISGAWVRLKTSQKPGALVIMPNDKK